MDGFHNAGGGMVNRYPLGLLGLLDLQAAGDAPHSIAPAVGIDVDATQLYLNSIVQPLFPAIVAVAAASPAGSIYYYLDASGADMGPIPGECWYVRYASVAKGAVNSAGTTKFGLAIGRRSGGFYPVSDWETDTTTELFRAWTRDLWLVPGDVLMLQVPTNTNGIQGNFSLNGFFARIRY